jgi:hypothetical protein
MRPSNPVSSAAAASRPVIAVTHTLRGGQGGVNVLPNKIWPKDVKEIQKTAV